ncbi:MAG: AAA family ATPase [bacterium]
MKRLPIGVQTFSKLIENNYVYVDKTRDIYNLFSHGGQYYFLSRPRRFGKSLLVSTIKEIFSGNKSLFKGLWIYDKIGWGKFPVIHLDFTKIDYKTPDILENELCLKIDEVAFKNNITINKKGSYISRFAECIEKLSNEGKVVILVDEYDKPIIDFIDQKEIALKNRDVLRNFYSVIKGSDEFIQFTLLTGVSKFARVSVFSGLNNLNDITVDEKYSTMLGYTQDELEFNFQDRISAMKKKFNLSKRELMDEIKAWYNGYSWDGKNYLYNPFSILNLFEKMSFGNYWFSSSTPTFLVKTIKKYAVDIKKIDGYESNQLLFDSFDIDRMNIYSLLFHTGYLAIKDVKDISLSERIFRFSYPNREVKESFIDYLLAEFAGGLPDEMGVMAYKLQDAIKEDDLEEFFYIIRSLFASIPYNIFKGENESYYHAVIYLILTLVGVRIKTEVQTNIGRIDAVIESIKNIYILEFKVGTSKQALDQIKEKRYYEKYMVSEKKIKLVGVGFNVKNRNISDYNAEEL